MVDQLNAFAGEGPASRARSAPKASSAARPKCPASPALETSRQRQLDAGNLTAQVRNIAEVATAIAAATCRARSPSTCAANPSAQETLNTMCQLNRSPASDARRARGRPKGARRPGQRAGVAGTWKDLTDSVNSMAGN